MNPSQFRSLLKPCVASLSIVLLAGCGETATLPVEQGQGYDPVLPPPNETLIPTVNIAKATGWSDELMPIAADGFDVNLFADELDHPRWLYVLPNGDVLVAESNAQPKPPQGIKDRIMGFFMKRAGAAAPSADRISLLRDVDGDGVAELKSAFLENLTSPFGMALVDGRLYVANTDAIVHFPYQDGDTVIEAPGETLAELPAGPINQHWTKNLIASEEGDTLYVSVGSNSNVGENGLENEENRAAILVVDRSSGDTEVYASGLRNPVGMDFNPVTGELWTAVNERDLLGSDLVPDYMTSVREGGFYGWPYSYFGDNVDERVQPQNPELVATAIKPDYALGPHTASLGLTFYTDDAFPPRYKNGAFVAQHGSWNRRPRSGYKVIFVPFNDAGMPSGLPEDILTGFVVDDEALGRPVAVVTANDGSLLVTDDVGNVVWRIQASD